jgi:cyclopropane fatty-acyl-phospholipid synthase-like methyltransferase
MIDDEWYRGFFEGLAAKFWMGVVPDEMTRGEIALIQSSLECTPGDSLLDIPCGNGRLALELARLGYSVTGVDLSDALLSDAGGQGVSGLSLVKEDMSVFQQPEAFKAAYCLGNSFGYLNYERQVRFLKNVADSLRSSGRFLIDAAVAAEVLLPLYEDEEMLGTREVMMKIRNSYEPAASCMITEYTFNADGKTESGHSLHYVYTIAEIHRMLAQAGFKVLELFGDHQGTNYEFGSAQLYILAAKV